MNSKKKEILLNVTSREVRYAELHHGKLYDLSIERNLDRIVAGNIYKGRVTHILKNIQSAFVDISEDSNGFIHISDILENTQKLQEAFDMDFGSDLSNYNSKNSDISELLKVEQSVLVQVVKEPMGTKGARLTSNLSIPGRYLVLLPNSPHRGVSRKIQDHQARERLKKIISSFEMPADVGLICRTASASARPEDLIEEAHELWDLWCSIFDTYNKTKGSVCLYRESDIIKKAVMTAMDHQFDRLLIDDHQAFLKCQRIAKKHENDPNNSLKIEFYRDQAPMFERFNIDKEIGKALRRKVWLPSGGYLFLDKTEAMLTIDVNSGRSTNTSSTNVEETIANLNLEAADEIARQLRLRNVGGLIICDFIDMRLRKNQRRVLDRLKEAMKDDGAKCTVLGMSEFGLVEMTRQRQRESLAETLCMPCPYCAGAGHIKNYETIFVELERELSWILKSGQTHNLEIVVHPEFYHRMEKSFLPELFEEAQEAGCTLSVKTNDSCHLTEFKIFSLDNGKELTV